jgi:hypothetical protein
MHRKIQSFDTAILSYALIQTYVLQEMQQIRLEMGPNALFFSCITFTIIIAAAAIPITHTN